MQKIYDVAVIGLGVVGSAIVLELSRRNYNVLGLDQFWPAHNRGSSYGESRMYRQIHLEGDNYTSMAITASECWRELEKKWPKPLRQQTGCLLVSEEPSSIVEKISGAAVQFDMGHKILTSSQLYKSYPYMNINKKNIGFLEQDAGIFYAEECVQALQGQAIAEGNAELRFGLKIQPDWEAALASDKTHMVLHTQHETILAKQVIIAAGPWTGNLLKGQVNTPILEVERVVSYWFKPKIPSPELANFPLFIWDGKDDGPVCGFPALSSSGYKFAFHHSGQLVDPDNLDREAGEDEITEIRRRLEAIVPSLNGRIVKSCTGMYTNTVDKDFAITRNKDMPLTVVSACCGRGFKFAPVVAQAVANLLLKGDPEFPIKIT